MALAMTLAHYPDAKLDEVAEGAPLLEDGPRIDRGSQAEQLVAQAGLLLRDAKVAARPMAQECVA